MTFFLQVQERGKGRVGGRDGRREEVNIGINDMCDKKYSETRSVGVQHLVTAAACNSHAACVAECALTLNCGS